MIELSVIIPCYNCADRIISLLTILHEQTNFRTDVEVILINDGSTDSTQLIIDKFIVTNAIKNFSLISTINYGAAKARQRGLELAKGRYVFFCDSDDLISYEFVPTILEYCKSNPDMIYFSSIIVEKNSSNKEGFITKSDKVRFSENLQFSSGDVFLIHQLNAGCWTAAVWTFVFKREVALINAAKFTDRLVHEDHLFSLNLILNSSRILAIKDVLYLQVLTQGSLTNSVKNWEYIEERYLAFNEARTYLLVTNNTRLIRLYNSWSINSIINLLRGNQRIYRNALQSSAFWRFFWTERNLICNYFFCKLKTKFNRLLSGI